MIVVDSYGWIEYFTDGPLADEYEKYLIEPTKIITPAIVVYEVYKKIKREKGEREALVALDQLKKTEIIVLDEDLATKAADVSLRYKVAMADAIVYATGQERGVKVVTSDPDLEDLPDVVFLKSPQRSK